MLQTQNKFLQETASATCSNFQVFGQVKKYNENVYISLKTKSKHQVT